MSRGAIEEVDFDCPTLPPSIDPVSVDDGRTIVGTLPTLGKLLRSIAVWLLYVPHLTLLRLLGPQLGTRWTRGLSRLHWVLTFVGAERSVRKIITELYPQFEGDRSVSEIIRKHLRLKHECFAHFKLFNRCQDGDGYGELIWEVDPQMVARFNRAKSSKNGLLIVGYHFGFFRLSLSRLPQIFPSCDAFYVSYRRAHYAGAIIDSVANLALQRALQGDEISCARIHYLKPESSAARIYRMLLSGETVALAADGLVSSDFVDVPYLGGNLRLPSGWARLAAATGSQVLILIDTEIDDCRRRVWVFDHVQVSDTSAACVYDAVAEAARILETFVRHEPWAWHPWQRLQMESGADGSRLLMLNALGQNSEANHQMKRGAVGQTKTDVPQARKCAP